MCSSVRAKYIGRSAATVLAVKLGLSRSIPETWVTVSSRGDLGQYGLALAPTGYCPPPGSLKIRLADIGLLQRLVMVAVILHGALASSAYAHHSHFYDQCTLDTARGRQFQLAVVAERIHSELRRQVVRRVSAGYHVEFG